ANVNFSDQGVLVWSDGYRSHTIAPSLYFEKRLDRLQKTRPPLAVSCASRRQLRQNAVGDSDQSPIGYGREFPAHHRAVVRLLMPVGEPGVGQHPGRIDLEHLSIVIELV